METLCHIGPPLSNEFYQESVKLHSQMLLDFETSITEYPLDPSFLKTRARILQHLFI